MLGLLFLGRGEDGVGGAIFHQLAQIHEGGEVGNAGRLLHIVRDDGDAVVGLQLIHQLLDLGGGDGVQRRGRLVQQQHGRTHGHGAGDAQALLLAAGQRQAALAQLVLDLGPQRGLAQRLFHAHVHIGAAQLLIQPDAVGDVVVDRHGEGRRLLEHHADAGAQQVQILLGRQQVLTIQQHLALGPLVGVEVVDTVQDAQQRGLAAAGRPDEGRHPLVEQRQVDVTQGVEAAVVEVQVADADLLAHVAVGGEGRLGLFRRHGKRGHGDHWPFLVPMEASMRAPMLSARMATVMRSEPPHARRCQSS
ncbi:hypothetical protein AZA_21096 [Nitrospirillum viridazoti Y2]|nr:hypothetical protein AZA_21096 [Nitrospirillum amazonense Y2]